MSVPFSADSVAGSVEALFNDVPKLRAQNKPTIEAPKHLQLSEEHRIAMNEHIEAVGTDRHIFQHNTADQGNGSISYVHD